VDEVNLLSDEIVDAILDAAAQGQYTVRRGPVRATYWARFVLIGSMNPEEGTLRPQILDRFGLRVMVSGLSDSNGRFTVYERVRQFRENPRAFIQTFDDETYFAREDVMTARQMLSSVKLSSEAQRYSGGRAHGAPDAAQRVHGQVLRVTADRGTEDRRITQQARAGGVFVNLKRLDRQQIALLSLIAAWLGIWGAWVPNVAASLSQNVFYLAEWSTFLPSVRSGEIRLVPDALRTSAALGVIALLVCAQAIETAWLRWLARLAAAAPIFFVLLPPYPDVFQLWWSPSYGMRFGAASLLGAGFAASAFTGRLPPLSQRLAIMAACLLAAAAAIAGLMFLIPPFQADYAAPFGIGWGSVLFFAGLALAALAQAQPEQTASGNKNGPAR
jgi:hypothetical protein